MMKSIRTLIVDDEVLARRRVRNLLRGRPIEGVADRGTIVCACFQVSAKQIETAAVEGHATVESIGRRLSAGTNCGSCIPEIRQLIVSLGSSARGCREKSSGGTDRTCLVQND